MSQQIDPMLGTDEELSVQQTSEEKKKPSAKQAAAVKKGKLKEEDLDFAEFGDYKPAKKEEHLYHVLMRSDYFNQKTRERIRKPFVQMFTTREYKQQSPMFEQLGYDSAVVLWNPEQ